MKAQEDYPGSQSLNELINGWDEDHKNWIKDPDDDSRLALTNDVRTADLTKYADKQLEARLAYYDQQYTFELHHARRQEFKIERDRTRSELNRRKMYQRAEADRVFEL